MVTPRILTFVGAKGGAGTTTLCLEVARQLRRNGTVALIDGDLSGRRSVAVMLDAVRTFDAMRSEGLAPITTLEGMKVLELAGNLSSSFSLHADSVQQMLEQLDGVDTIVVDAPQPFAGALRPLVIHTAKFVIVMEPTLLGATGARVLVTDYLGAVAKERLAVVVQSRSYHYAQVERREMQRLLEVPILAEIPPREDRGFARAVTALSNELAQIPPNEEKVYLTTSKTPVGERRTDVRRVSMAAEEIAAVTMPDKPAQPSRDRKSWEALKRQIHEDLATALDAASLARADEAKIAEVRDHVHGYVQRLLVEQPGRIELEQVDRLCDEVVNEALGLGPLEGLVGQPDLSEIMVNGPDKIYIERNGKIELTAKTFRDEAQLRLIIERIVAPLGRHIDEAAPMVDARLPDGSRVNAIIPPLSLTGPILTIRMFGTKPLDVDDLIRLGSVTPGIMDFLRAAVQARLNIMITGGTGSGKTTFLNVLSGYIPPTERIITIEDAAELQLHQTHVIRLEARPPNIEGHGEIRIRDLVRNALRMRPDRIVVGECRSAEALDMLQAMNTGHDGSLTTVHANSSRDALARVETMVMMAGFDLPVRVIREQIASAMDLVIHTARLRDGSRKIVSVDEVVGMEGDVVTMQEVFGYKLHGMTDGQVKGRFEYSGVQPECLKRFEELGIQYDPTHLPLLATA